jgi:hypothetical protein
MKKMLVFLCLFLLLSVSIFAQVSVGFIGGANVNYNRGETWEEIVSSEAGEDADSPGV